MTKLLEVTVPVLRVSTEETNWGEKYFFVQQRQKNGRWKRVSENYNHVTSAKAKLGNVFLAFVAEAEENE